MYILDNLWYISVHFVLSWPQLIYSFKCKNQNYMTNLKYALQTKKVVLLATTAERYSVLIRHACLTQNI